MLGSMDVVAFVPTRNRQKGRPYYEKTLGLPAPFTILGWSVADIGKTVKGLGKKGSNSSATPARSRTKSGSGLRRVGPKLRGSRIQMAMCSR